MDIIGVDEVGRGAWAGPVCVGAARLHVPVLGLADSKALTPRKRLQFARLIRQHADIGIGWARSSEVDTLGLNAALALAMQRALRHFDPTLPVLLDGSYNYLPKQSNISLMIKADVSVPAVSAAAIVAKVARDQYMAMLAKRFPAYGFDTHVGYGTQHHQEMLNVLGPCVQHRQSFTPIKQIVML